MAFSQFEFNASTPRNVTGNAHNAIFDPDAFASCGRAATVINLVEGWVP